MSVFSSIALKLLSEFGPLEGPIITGEPSIIFLTFVSRIEINSSADDNPMAFGFIKSELTAL